MNSVDRSSRSPARSSPTGYRTTPTGPNVDIGKQLSTERTAETVDNPERAEHGAMTGNTGDTPAHPETHSVARPVRRPWWRVDCRDTSRARRSLTVFANRDKVVLVGPPGNTVGLRAEGVDTVATALRKAADQARK